MLGNYLQQKTSADDIFRIILFGALRVKSDQLYAHLDNDKIQDFYQLLKLLLFA